MRINRITIRPTDKKMKTAKQTIENGLSKFPKEMSIEKPVHIITKAELFKRAKYVIQNSIDNIKR